MSTQQDKANAQTIEAMGRRMDELEAEIRAAINFFRSLFGSNQHSVGGALHDSNVRLDRYGNPSRQSDY